MKKYKVEFVAYSIIDVIIEVPDDESIDNHIFPEMDIDILDYLSDICNSGVDKINEIREIKPHRI